MFLSTPDRYGIILLGAWRSVRVRIVKRIFFPKKTVLLRGAVFGHGCFITLLLAGCVSFAEPQRMTIRMCDAGRF